MSDPYDLQRFVEAQEGVYGNALAEIRRGRKRSHWMWFVFPQIAGLGSSAMAERYAITSLAEAKAFLAHPIVGQRYIECVTALQDLSLTSAEAVFGATDALKLGSSLTLFEAAGAGPTVSAAIDRWYDGVRDPATLASIG